MTNINLPDAAFDFLRIFFQNRLGDAFVFDPITNNFSIHSHEERQSRRGLADGCIQKNAKIYLSSLSGKSTHDRKTFQKVQNEAIEENRKLDSNSEISPDAIYCFSGCSRMRSRIIFIN